LAVVPLAVGQPFATGGTHPGAEGRVASGAGECPHRGARAGLTATGSWSGDRDGVSAVAGFVAGRRACACRFGGDAVNWANRAGATPM
jgi:hypothetical protein